MARIDIKAASKLRDRLCEAAIAFSDAHAKTRKRASAASKSLRVEEAKVAAERLLDVAIAFVGALATTDDGYSAVAGVSITDGIRILTSKPEVFGATFRELRKKPYARVFARAEKEADS